MGAMIWWLVDWNDLGNIAFITSAVTLSGVAMGFAIAGLCAFARRASSSELLFIATNICQCKSIMATVKPTLRPTARSKMATG